MFVLLDEKAWCFGEEEQAGADDDAPEELHGDRDAVGAAVVAALSCVIYYGGEEEALLLLAEGL